FKGLVNRFKNCKKIENWYVSPSGKIVDPFKCLNKVFEMNEFTFFRMMNEYRQEVKESGNVFREIWETLSELIEEPNPQYGHLYTIKRFLAQIPGNSILHVANSNSIRVVQHFKILPSVDVHCNRGTDGIDGSMSSMIGQASSTDKIVFLMIGDLSFFYDMNALWNRHVGKNVRILLNNNGGGAIMHMPKRPDFAAEHLPNFISAKHSTSARAWAIDRGFKYLTASTREEVEEQMQIFTNEKTERPIIFEVFSDMLEDTEILKGYYQDIKRDTLEEKLRKRAGVVKRKIYSILGRS
ncbi:MAG: 2-succinyl-5-enolpyruvyl-6-hydroxy-3-cyclohexene-1-carboxylic-acid synthase, partial [Muribaculaceae bacterium]|nr:2-succinyl-5-enolpyruvyl-6-hydroxy-3-cyclohexene-1-carboxylic-acid synthase [Muribaculaceae bacterium]